VRIATLRIGSDGRPLLGNEFICILCFRHGLKSSSFGDLQAPQAAAGIGSMGAGGCQGNSWVLSLVELIAWRNCA
jgi:hypothetical protein